MSESANNEDGARASTMIQVLITQLLERGFDAKAVSVVTCSIGAAMVVCHYGETDGGEIGHGLIDSAKQGELNVFTALKAANSNLKE